MQLNWTQLWLGLVCLIAAVSCKDYYDILGVQKTDTIAQIKKAFRGLALKYHPGV